MAKKKTAEPSTPTPAPARETRSSVRAAARATRSATRRGDASLTPPVDNPQPRRSKMAKIDGAFSSAASGASSSPAAGAPSPAAAGASSSGAAGGSSSAAAGKTVVIEHCLQAEIFKTKAEQVKKGLEKSIPGVKVVLNPEAPRKGCFEIRFEDGSVVFESLLDVEKPFQAVKALDVKKVVSETIRKI